MLNVLPACRNILATVLLVFAQSALALETIDWQSLVPPLDKSKDTFSQLSEELQDSVFDLWMVEQRKAAGSTNEALDDLGVKARARLAENGIDADAILVEMEEFAEMVEANDNKLVDDLDGKDVKIPGYVLPIEFSGDKVVEFLLVPYVGACVHTPPPPANQMVHVKVTEGFESQGLFMPVWVTGQMSAAMSTQAISFEDGAANVEAGYRIDASGVIPYE